MDGRGTRRMTGQGRERLSPCVCSTLRMVSRAVTQLYDDILRPSGLRVTQFSILGAIADLGDANLRQLEHTLGASRRAHQGDEADIKGEKNPRGRAPALDPRSR